MCHQMTLDWPLLEQYGWAQRHLSQHQSEIKKKWQITTTVSNSEIVLLYIEIQLLTILSGSAADFI